MCGRYGLYDTDDFALRFQTGGDTMPIEPNYNAAPGQFMPVITENAGRRNVEIMRWGLVPSWAKDIKIGYKMINARAETVFEKPAWRGVVRHHRALIPARGFYEWQRQADKSPKQPYFIHPRDQELFAFAGLYSVWHSPDGSELPTYTIITTNANEDMAAIHDRMPVILHPDQEAIWLDPEIQDRSVLTDLLTPYEEGNIEMYEVSTDVNIVKNNDNHLVYPLNSR